MQGVFLARRLMGFGSSGGSRTGLKVDGEMAT